ncbi:MAG: hypothetical protein KF799_14590 [Bdellovibrionales bacterium]|nr:hypothetical protein [Bdellovibrionales bacterium]
MKTLIAKIAATGLVLAGLGCGLHQDPLAGQDARFRDGRPAPTKPIYDKPLSSESIVFNQPQYMGVEEDEMLEFDLTARALIDGYAVSLQIENMIEFPGATYAPATGKFKWKPARGFVASVGGANRIERVLRVRATGVKADKPVLFRDTTVTIGITRDYTEPQITMVRKDSNTLREGYDMYLRIRVKDLDANDSDKNTWPEVLFTRVGSNKSLMGWIGFYSATKAGPNEYEFTYRIDLSGAELTPAGADFTTGIQAISRYGKRSAQQTMTLTVFTSLSEPDTTWEGTQIFKAGEKRLVQFVIFDPKQEGTLSLRSWQDVPAGANISCLPSTNSAAVLNCTMEWEPTPDQSGAQAYIRAVVQSRNSDTRDTTMPSYNVYLSYRVAPSNFIPVQEKE